MRETDLSIDKTIIASSSLSDQLSEHTLKNGWGVFRHVGGISSMPSTELCSVWAEETQAAEEAKQLNSIAGKTTYEDMFEETVWHSVSFSIGRVALVGTEISIRAKYERIID